jgi:hypothetical protein
MIDDEKIYKTFDTCTNSKYEIQFGIYNLGSELWTK